MLTDSNVESVYTEFLLSVLIHLLLLVIAV